MIQLCGKEIVLPLQLLFKSMLEEGIFREDWKKSNVVPVIKNYRPIKFGSHCGDELHRPPSSPVINLVGNIEGSSPNLHRRR